METWQGRLHIAHLSANITITALVFIYFSQWTIIDDSFEHEILNDSEKPRLILIIDFHHPDISREENKAEFNWSKEDMVQSGLARSQEISGGFP